MIKLAGGNLNLTNSRWTLRTRTRDIVIRRRCGSSGSEGGGEVERVSWYVLEGGEVDEDGFGELVELLAQFEHFADEHFVLSRFVRLCPRLTN